LQSQLPSGDAKTDKRIAQAIKKLQNSLDANLWLTDSTLTPKGSKEFSRTKKATKEMMKIVKQTPTAASSYQPLIDNVVEAQRLLAQIALDQAIAEGGHVKQIDQSQKEMVKAQQELAKGRPDQAIEHNKKAWQHAQAAIQAKGRSADDTLAAFSFEDETEEADAEFDALFPDDSAPAATQFMLFLPAVNR
jgi:hypothetical protein